jgi:hypothetical protein
MKKIISFSLYGKDPKYTDAMVENIKLQPEIYPNWTVRVYVDDTVPPEYLEKMDFNDTEIIMKPRGNGHLRMFWRFEPLMDETIDRFIVRDADSRLNLREAAAVREWEQSNSEFHIMRDHEQHAAPICGGMWGASSRFIKRISKSYKNILGGYLNSIPFEKINSPRGPYFNTDQPFLWKYIWPRIVNTHMAHIKDLDVLRFTGNERFFPIENPDGSFVGQPY